MEYNELLSLLQENMYPDCWVGSINHENLTNYTLKDNIAISIEELPEEEDKEISNEFTDRFINDSAFLCRYALKYNGSTVKNVMLFCVDGGRAIIPAPKLVDRNYIHDDNLIISVIIDRLTYVGRYIHDDTTNFLKQAKLEFQDSLIK